MLRLLQNTHTKKVVLFILKDRNVVWCAVRVVLKHKTSDLTLCFNCLRKIMDNTTAACNRNLPTRICAAGHFVKFGVD